MRRHVPCTLPDHRCYLPRQDDNTLYTYLTVKSGLGGVSTSTSELLHGQSIEMWKLHFRVASSKSNLVRESTTPNDDVKDGIRHIPGAHDTTHIWRKGNSEEFGRFLFFNYIIILISKDH